MSYPTSIGTATLHPGARPWTPRKYRLSSQAAQASLDTSGMGEPGVGEGCVGEEEVLATEETDESVDAEAMVGCADAELTMRCTFMRYVHTHEVHVHEVHAREVHQTQ